MNGPLYDYGWTGEETSLFIALFIFSARSKTDIYLGLLLIPFQPSGAMKESAIAANENENANKTNFLLRGIISFCFIKSVGRILLF